MRTLLTPYRLALAATIAVVVAVHAANILGWPVLGDDEGTYTAQAWAVLQGKLAHYTYWYDHPPVGWILLAVPLGLLDLLGVPPTVGTARITMLGFTAASAVLIARLGSNIGLRPWARLAAVLLWGLSPLTVYFGRQVLLDNIQLPLLLGAFVMATCHTRRLWRQVLAGALFGLACLVKETSLVLFPALAWLTWRHAYRPVRHFSLVGLVTAVGLTGAFYPLFALLKRELLTGEGHVSLQDAVTFQLVSRAGSGVVWDRTSAAHGVLDSWLALDSFLPVAGLVAALVILIDARTRGLGIVVLIMAAVMARPHGYLPIMFIVGALPFLALSIVLVAQGVARAVVRRGGRAPAALACAVVAASLAFAPRTPAWATATGHDANANYMQAIAWTEQNLPRSTRVISDDAVWTYLVAAGWSGDGWSGAIWHFKLDLDPAVERELPGGWLDVDYVILSEPVRQAIRGGQQPLLTSAVNNSTPVAAFGEGEHRVEVRRIRKENP